MSGLIGKNLKRQTKVKNNFRLNWSGKSFPAEPGKFGVNATPICASFAAMMDVIGVRDARDWTERELAASRSSTLTAERKSMYFTL
ncbi:hypothetical protein [Massilia sp. DWR3-1-1]|uniref:hypothetical protein n=1 Tax=Massilia sp. DWR3-1-1 TaxID=2804559 RepID=UPI003CF2DC81